MYIVVKWIASLFVQLQQFFPLYLKTFHSTIFSTCPRKSYENQKDPPTLLVPS